ncbi:MAG: hypothetical protein IPQ07_40040 [Myxococcales bacterium]|nr:hypothetical protein [Myxococcales bacterium]
MPYVVTMKHSPNPDIPGGYWDGIKPQEGPAMRHVPTLQAAAAECRAYIERNNLGGGNWTGGQVFADKRTQVARVSFNGRVWAMDGTEVF